MPARRLVSRIREFPGSGGEEYDARWEEVRRSATALGAHAWRFHSTSQPNRSIEFLEFPADADPRRDPSLRAALLSLDRLGEVVEEEWQDAGG